MDVKTYYQRIRTTEATITTPFAVVSSLGTDDGGKKGVLVEVPRHLAAKMIVEPELCAGRACRTPVALG